jgi:hypothetical protein
MVLLAPPLQQLRNPRQHMLVSLHVLPSSVCTHISTSTQPAGQQQRALQLPPSRWGS